MARPARSLGDLPPDVLLKIAGGCEVVEDILALRACCRGARAALDARGWRQLTVGRFGAAAAGAAGRCRGDLKAEMRKYSDLESPVLRGLEDKGVSCVEEQADRRPWTEGGWDDGLSGLDWDFCLDVNFPAVPAGTYVLQAYAGGQRPEVPFSVTLSWQGEPKHSQPKRSQPEHSGTEQSESEESESEQSEPEESESEESESEQSEPQQQHQSYHELSRSSGGAKPVKRQLTLDDNPSRFSRKESFRLKGQADWPFTLPSQGPQQRYSVTCRLEAGEENTFYMEGEETVEFHLLRLRKLRQRQPEEAVEGLKGLSSFMESVLGDRVARVASSSCLADAPCALVVPSMGWSPAQALGKKRTAEYMRGHEVLGLNAGHPLIQALNKVWRTDKARAKAATELLYEASLVAAGGGISSREAFADRAFSVIGLAVGADKASARAKGEATGKADRPRRRASKR